MLGDRPNLVTANLTPRPFKQFQILSLSLFAGPSLLVNWMMCPDMMACS
ncbi:hypothetical protein CA85_06400 [Allorhodopirellula solitaria]|uniref:Uncharacterized protein n=1 Tax=Allorhodopirellula solitaria TaxID=2527987 RepID=A0A5C5YKK2_9BACT|nr:hypothetical protein CA85_06400 [Allorhodopirellula solitaria]